MAKRKSMTRAKRIRILEAHGARCYLSGFQIDPLRDRWDIEHVIPLAAGGSDDDSNLRPALKEPHKIKTKQDIKHISKGKRVRANYLGAKGRKSRPMPGTRGSGWRHKMDGSWERRT